MGQFVYSTRLSFSAPVLIDRESLEVLDKIVTDEEQKLVAANEREIQQVSELNYQKKNRPSSWKLEEYIEEQKSTYPFSRREKRFVVSFLGGKRFDGQSLTEILRQPEVEKDVPVGFSYKLTVGSFEAEIETSRRDHELNIVTSPEHSSASRELFASLQSWANKVKAPAWQMLLCRFGSYAWVLFLLLFCFSAPALVEQAKDTRKAVLREQAFQILTNGLKQDQQLKAVELILAFESGFEPPHPLKKEILLSRTFWLIFFLSLAVCVIVSIRPTVEIGIGRGQARIKLWRRWLTVAFLSLPTWVVGTFFMPKIDAFLKSLI
jgi:hypothetical protein